jgi:hypothetical protein
MPSAPSGNSVRVTIGDSHYEVAEAGTGRYTVFDEFGAHLGYFEMRGRAVVPDDYGVEGAHPIATVAKAWAAAAGPVVQKPSLQVCRIAKSSDVDDVMLTRAKAYVGWLKECGAKVAFLTHDPAAKTLSSLSVWGSRQRLASALEKQAPVDAAEPDGTTVELHGLVQDL